MTGAVNARSKRQQEKWRFESAVANESTDLLLTLGDSDDAEKKTAASTITKVVSWNDAWVSTFGDYAKTATVKLTGTEAVNKIIVSENGALTETAAGSLRIHSDGGMRHSSIPESAPAQGTLISQPCAKVLP